MTPHDKRLDFEKRFEEKKTVVTSGAIVVYYCGLSCRLNTWGPWVGHAEGVIPAHRRLPHSLLCRGGAGEANDQHVMDFRQEVRNGPDFALTLVAVQLRLQPGQSGGRFHGQDGINRFVWGYFYLGKGQCQPLRRKTTSDTDRFNTYYSARR